MGLNHRHVVATEHVWMTELVGNNRKACREGKLVRELRALPLAEDIPISFNSVRQGPRSVDWRSDKPAEVCWIETQVDSHSLKLNCG